MDAKHHTTPFYTLTMPPVSQSQRRWAFWQAAHGKTAKDRAVGVEFEGPGVKGLPEKVHPATTLRAKLKAVKKV